MLSLVRMLRETLEIQHSDTDEVQPANAIERTHLKGSQDFKNTN